MVIPEGELLNFRLYEDGRFEYDKLADLDKNPWADPQFTRKASKLSAEQLREIDNLIKEPETIAAKSRYETIHKHIDDYWFTTILIKSGASTKTIKIVNFWDIKDHPEDKASYPAALVKLLFLTAKLNEQLTEKE